MTPYERRNAIHNRQGKILTQLVSFLIIAPVVFFVSTGMVAAIFGVDLWGAYEPSPVPGWWDAVTDRFTSLVPF